MADSTVYSIHSLPPEILRIIFAEYCRIKLTNYFVINRVCKKWSDNTMNILKIFNYWDLEHRVGLKANDPITRLNSLVIDHLLPRNLSSIEYYSLSTKSNRGFEDKLTRIIDQLAPQLKFFSHNTYSTKEFELFHKMTRLESLKLPICMQRGQVHNTDFYHITCLTSLRSLVLDPHCERIPTSNAIGKVTTLVNLTRLVMTGVNVTDENMKKFIAPMTSLREISIDTCRKLVSLTFLHGMTTLTRLSLLFSEIPQDSISLSLKRMTHLKVFSKDRDWDL